MFNLRLIRRQQTSLPAPKPYPRQQLYNAEALCTPWRSLDPQTYFGKKITSQRPHPISHADWSLVVQSRHRTALVADIFHAGFVTNKVELE